MAFVIALLLLAALFTAMLGLWPLFCWLGWTPCASCG